MGVAAADEEQARSALDALDRAEWLRPVAPVQVLQADCRPAIVDLVLPDDTGQLVWRLVLENGNERSGQVSFDNLHMVGECQLDGCVLQRRRLNLGVDLPCGYHRLFVEPGRATMTVVITPGHCWLPSTLVDGDRMWGIAVQLYLLRSAANWGIGDFGDLQMLVRLASAQGADVIGLNPLHGMFSDDPEHASPYSPASRLLLNILNIDVTTVPELNSSAETCRLIESEAFQKDLQACRTQHLVDYLGVMRLKLKALEPLFEACRMAPARARWQAFEEFRHLHGEVLQRNCLFLALHEHFAMNGLAHTDWHEWPKEYRDPVSPAVARFADESRRRLDFLVWLQWIADEQLGKAAATARKHDMAVGLYRDLAVGADRTGHARGPGEVGMGRARQDRDTRWPSFGQQAFAAQCGYKLILVPPAHFSLTRRLLRLREQAKALLQIDIPAFPPAAKGRQIVAADDGQRQVWVGARLFKGTRFRVLLKK